MELALLLLKDALLAAIPATGFAMVFNVPPRVLPYCAAAGALGHSLRTLLLETQLLDLEWATLMASISIGFIGVYWSRKLLLPRPTFTVAAIIPMIPGSLAFKAMIAVVHINEKGYSQELLAVAVENGLKSVFIIGALAIGLAIPSLLIFRQKPII